MALIVIASCSALAGATYRIAEIDEVTVSYNGDAAVQFVNGTKLTALDAEGNLSSVALPVNGNVASGGADRRWPGVLGDADPGRDP